MKTLLLVVVLSVVFAVKSQPLGAAQLDALFSDPAFTAAFREAAATHMTKRNSELLNSMLALPMNIHRSGKRNSELLNSLMALDTNIHRAGKRNSELLDSMMSLPMDIHRAG